ncbi:hypothetical protein BN2475_860021 [Paraburkholderia ribeironis]|uniref:Uncharacterized protein n=1 Tax=Paraburkholderia ribeironis TaxID=1247936 RepID=A0A1N7SKL2_9BURK|nr:hypothetical protein BN2475_860021 [Paraburkholderia ribeironis]
MPKWDTAAAFDVNACWYASMSSPQMFDVIAGIKTSPIFVPPSLSPEREYRQGRVVSI